jgi:hypothetical protein
MLLRALPDTRTLLQALPHITMSRALPHTATCTAAHIRLRTAALPYTAALPDSRILPQALPHTTTHTAAYCRTMPQTAYYKSTALIKLPHTAHCTQLQPVINMDSNNLM